MNATVSPLFALNEILFIIHSSASGYLNDTFLNSTVPISFPFVLVPSFIFTYIESVNIYITKYIIGDIIANVFWLNSCCFVNLLFTSLNLFS